MRKEALAIIIILALALTACTSNTITITHEGTSQKARVGSQTIPLSELIKHISTPEDYVYTFIGDKESTITYEELIDGSINGKDNSLSFNTIMCECADINNITKITTRKKTIIQQGEETHIVLAELKAYIEGYVTTTPKAYEYAINGKPVTYEDLEEAPVITMVLPAGSIELKLAGDHPTAAYQATLGDAIQQFTTTPGAYTYYIDREAIDLAANEDLIDEQVTLKRHTLTIRNDDHESTMRLSTTTNTDLGNFITIEGKEELEYKLTSAEGFSPPPLAWESFSTGTWLAEGQVTSFDAAVSKKYSIRDLAAIDIVRPTVKPTVSSIKIADQMETVTRSEHEGEPAIRLSEFIKDLEQPENYVYKLTAKDGYSPEAFSYDDLQEGYLLLKKQETFFPSKDIGKNRIRDLESITPTPAE